MTEQSKIPLPPAGKPKSLFERAEGLFGLDAFAPPPVPADVAEPPAKRPSRKGPSAAAEPRPFDQAPAEPEARVEPEAPAVRAEPAPSAEPEAIRFSNELRPIDRARLVEQGLIEPEGKVTALLEEFRIVKRQLLLSARAARRNGGGARAQRVLVCSPLPGEGKTFCATNLALAIAAEKDSEVVLVDADFAKPSILSTLGLSASSGVVRGLMDSLADPTIRVEECVIATDVPGLYVLPAGNTTNSDSEFLASARTEQVLDRLTQGAPNRIVIFDSPPALAASPASELAMHVGQAVMVVRADVTGEAALRDAVGILSGCADIKLLLNGTRFSPTGRRFGTYYGYKE